MEQFFHKILANNMITVYDSRAHQEHQKWPGRLSFKKSTWRRRPMQRGVGGISDQRKSRYGSRTLFLLQLAAALVSVPCFTERWNNGSPTPYASYYHIIDYCCKLNLNFKRLPSFLCVFGVCKVGVLGIQDERGV